MSKAPIIVVGAHRSGTSMFTEMLDVMGVFVGWRLDEHHEAIFFQDINEWALRSAGGAWDNPTAFLRFTDRDLKLIAEYAGDLLASPRAVAFLGGRYPRVRNVRSLDVPWGWKDPRNTFTLPVWLELMPEAKVIHVVRNGVDVANSLKVRSVRNFERRLEKARRRRALRALTWIRPKKGGFIDSPRSATLEGAFEIWEEYVDRGRDIVAALGDDRATEIRFEDLVADPDAVLDGALAFIGEPGLDKSAALQIGDESRSLAYRDDPVLAEFAESVAARLALRGY